MENLTPAQVSSEVTSAQGPNDQPLANLPRELGRVEGELAGPTLICVAGLHGNEPAGVVACQRVLARMRDESHRLRGRLVCLTGNAGSTPARATSGNLLSSKR